MGPEPRSSPNDLHEGSIGNVHVGKSTPSFAERRPGATIAESELISRPLRGPMYSGLGERQDP